MTDTFCLTHAPMRLSHKTIDAMTPAEVNTILKYNEDGAARCGWKP